MRVWFAGMMATVLASGALADPLDGRTARQALFHHKGGEIVVFPQDFLTPEQVAQLNLMGGLIQYYGAMAMAPGEGFMSEANQAAANHHSVEAATEAALSACNAARSGGRPCVVVAHFLPRDWEEGHPVQLSQSATEAFRRDYRRGRGPKAFAISAETGAFAVERGESATDAALAACNEKAEELGATDCNIVIAD